MSDVSTEREIEFLKRYPDLQEMFWILPFKLGVSLRGYIKKLEEAVEKSKADAWQKAIEAQCRYCRGPEGHHFQTAPVRHEGFYDVPGFWVHEVRDGIGSQVDCDAGPLHEARRKEGG